MPIRLCAPFICLFIVGLPAYPAQAQEPAVFVLKPERRDMSRWLAVTGSVKAMEEATVFARATGYAYKVYVDIGDMVEMGQPLVDILAPEVVPMVAALRAEVEHAAAQHAKATDLESVAKALLKEARARVEVARAQQAAGKARHSAARTTAALRRVTAERLAAMASQGAATQQQLDEAEAALQEADSRVLVADADLLALAADLRTMEVRVGVAQSQLLAASREISVREAESKRAASALVEAEIRASWLTVDAPLSGRITARHVHRGTYVRGGGDSNSAPLFHIQSAGPVRIQFEVPSSEAHLAQPGRRARILGRGIEGGPVEAEIGRLAGARSRETRGLPAEIHVDDSRLMPGMFVTVEIDIETRADVITVPIAALLEDKQGVSVYAVEAGTVRRVPVVPGLRDPHRAEIVSGLSGGEDVIVRGKDQVRPGIAVRARPEEASTREGDGR